VGNPKQQPNFPAARSTPTVEGDVLWALGSDGDLACVETAGGKVRWRKSLRADFAGKPGGWAYTESPLVDGDALIVTPGGTEATMVALRKTTGDVLWKCAIPGADEAAYASAIAVEAAGVRQYVQVIKAGLVGVEAKAGRFLWRYPKPVSRFNANIPTPLAGGDIVYVASAGTGGGAVRLKADAGGVAFDELYFDPKLPTAIGGAILLDGFLYGTTAQGMMCVEFASGKVRWEDRSIGAASLCHADGRLYLHGENGEAALVEPSPQGYREKGRFTPPDGPKHTNAMEKAWAHPLVAGGRLYLRDHGCLWCYAVK
jgi:outer membrane protein assembly factor BamB